jgi:hypothetical protein
MSLATSISRHINFDYVYEIFFLSSYIAILKQKEKKYESFLSPPPRPPPEYETPPPETDPSKVLLQGDLRNACVCPL